MKKHSILTCVTALLLAVTLLFSSTQVLAVEKDGQVLNDLTACAGWPTAPTIESNGAILIDAKTGAILYGKNDDTQMWPASITKLMTALLTFENCELDDTVTFSYRATHELEAGATSIARTEGEQMSVEDCLYALLFMSANEVAQGLAEHVGGTIEDFAVMMNERAKELGCTQTNFITPSGLHNDAHVTTCRDMAIIMRALIQEPEFLEMESHDYYYIPPTNKHDVETAIAQKHDLVHSGGRHYEGALAGKTGYTVTAGHSLVTYAVRGDLELICVVMESKATHYTDTVALLDYGFNNFSSIHLSEAAGADDFARNTLISTGQYSEEDLQNTFLSEDDWLVIPKNVALTALTGQADVLTDAAETDEGVPVAAIDFYLGNTKIGTSTLLNATEITLSSEETSAAEDSSDTGVLSEETDAQITETTEEETEAPADSTLEGSWWERIPQYIHSFLLALGTLMHDWGLKALHFLADLLNPDRFILLYQRYGWKFIVTLLGGIILVIVVIRRLIRRRNMRKKNPYIQPKDPHRNGPKMRKKKRFRR